MALKRFDHDSIRDRMLQRLVISEDWANVLGAGTLGNLIDTVADSNAEIARYLEYLYNEKKWRNARNMSSLTHLADLISYKRALPKSAIGYVVVSHTDPDGIARLPNFGTTFFELDQPSDWDEREKALQATFIERTALIPWLVDPYTVPLGTSFKTPSGIRYFALENVSSRPLTIPYSQIAQDPSKSADFIRAGGWNGIKFLKVPVIEGEIVTVEFGEARGNRFESFVIDAINIENASNVISEKFFKVTVTPNMPEAVPETWEKIHNLRLAQPWDKVFECKILNNEDRVLIKFGDGITGQMLPRDANLSVQYLETRGARGNVEDRYQITQMSFPPGIPMIDPRTNRQSAFLSCTNIVPIMGGQDVEDEEDIRVRAPASYLKSYAIATQKSYYEQILRNSPVSLLHCRVFQSGTYTGNSYGRQNDEFVSNIQNSVLQEITMSRSSLLITAIRSNGDKLIDPQNELINPLIRMFADQKSPNDTFDYIEPNFVRIRPNVIINTPETLTETEIKDEVSPKILAAYSIFNTDFERPYHKSEIINIVQSSPFSQFTDIFLEAKVEADLVPIIINNTGNAIVDRANTHLAFPFKFDKIFAQNQLNAGFRNFKSKQPFVIRADARFTGARAYNDRSFFLMDRRVDLRNVITLNEAELQPIISNYGVPEVSEKRLLTMQGIGEARLFDDYAEEFYNQQSRTAQFNFIDRVVSGSYFHQMEQFNIEPYELRPLFVDVNGRNAIFDIEDVPLQERLGFDFISTGAAVTGNQCYRLNKQFVRECKLMFSENYGNVDEPNYAMGYLILPLEYVFPRERISEMISRFEANNVLSQNERMADELAKFCEGNFEINVYARPLEENFEAENEHDIIFSERSDMLIQKNLLIS